MKKRKHIMTRIEKKEMKIAYIMLFPAMAFLSVFVLIPLCMAFKNSFYDWNYYIDSTFVGLENYRMILSMNFFQISVKNILKFLFLQVPLMILLSFLFAQVLKTVNETLSRWVKTVIYLPGIISGIVASIIVTFMLDYKGGIISLVLMKVGIGRVAVLNKPALATLAVIITNIWLGFGGNTILMYAGLMTIPREYYEAASVDGANVLQKMIYITLPQLKNIFVLMCVNLTAGTLQMLDVPYMLTGGGPLNSTLTPMLYIYNCFKDVTKGMGYTVAGSFLMVFIIAVINSIVFRIIKTEKSLEG